MKTTIELDEADLTEAITLLVMKRGYNLAGKVQFKHVPGGHDDRDQVSWPETFKATVQVEPKGK
jgi:hypothetical protein